LDANAAERHGEYFMGEGGGFPRIRAMVSQVSPGLPMAYPSTKSPPECELTNLLVGLMQVRVTKQFVPLPNLIPELSARPSHPPPLVLEARSVPRIPRISAT